MSHINCELYSYIKGHSASHIVIVKDKLRVMIKDNLRVI